MKKAPKSFEEGLERLRSVLAAMQEPDTPLAESVKLYAEAAELIRYCNKMLDDAELQIKEIDTRLNNADSAAGETDDGQ